MNASLLPRLEISLKNGDLHDLVDILDSEGFSQLEIYDVFYQLKEKLREENREAEEDEVDDEMDTIVGWGNHSYWHHFSRPYTKEEKDLLDKQIFEHWKKKFNF